MFEESKHGSHKNQHGSEEEVLSSTSAAEKSTEITNI